MCFGCQTKKRRFGIFRKVATNEKTDSSKPDHTKWRKPNLKSFVISKKISRRLDHCTPHLNPPFLKWFSRTLKTSPPHKSQHRFGKLSTFFDREQHVKFVAVILVELQYHGSFEFEKFYKLVLKHLFLLSLE